MPWRAKFALGLILAMSALSAQGAIRREPVSYQDNGIRLRGYITWDDKIVGKRPGVLVAHEWWGLNDYVRRRTEMLAGLGYVAFAADLYGEGKFTQHPAEAKEWMEQIAENKEAWRRRALAGVEILRKHPLVDRSRLAAIGYCFGGATVMQLAYAGTDLRGVVSFHGSLPIPTEEETGQIKAHILALQGAADTFVPAERIVAFEKALEQAGADWTFITYGHARHAFTVPDAAKYGQENLAYNEKADRRSWAAMQLFLREVFGGK